MNVVDSSAWIEFFVDGPNARFFSDAVSDVERLLVPAVCLQEVYRWVLPRHGREAALGAAATMKQGTVIALDDALAVEAAEVGATLGLPLAGSIVYATAVAYDAVVWTQDADFEGLDRVRYRRKKPAR